MGNLVQLGIVAAVLGALWFTVQWLQRRQQGATATRLTVQQRLAVSNQLQLLVVRWDGNELLLSAGGNECRLLASTPVPVKGGSTADLHDLDLLLSSLPATSAHFPGGQASQSPFLVSSRSPK